MLKTILLISLRVLLLMVPLFPIQWQSHIFSATIFLRLPIKRSLIFHFQMNIFHIFFKIGLIFYFFKSHWQNKNREVISSLDSNKSVGPNNIPTKVLKLLKNDVSSQLSEIFISFSPGVFPSILKTAKVTLVHKKDSKLVFSNYHPISILSNIQNFLERWVYNRVYKFFSENNLIYSLQFSFIQKYSTVHALITLTENIRKNLDEGNIGCGKHDIFYQTLNNMVCVVLLMNGLINLIFQIENNMFQLMVIILILLT